SLIWRYLLTGMQPRRPRRCTRHHDSRRGAASCVRRSGGDNTASSFTPDICLRARVLGWLWPRLARRLRPPLWLALNRLLAAKDSRLQGPDISPGPCSFYAPAKTTPTRLFRRLFLLNTHVVA